MGSSSSILGLPTAVLALIVAALSFAVALSALAWQIAKHLLDGGRVRVYLNTAILDSGVGLITNGSGRFEVQASGVFQVTRRNIEVAQLIVENPGRTAITIHGPTLSVAGVKHRSYAIAPRFFAWGKGDGADDAITSSKVRIDPYSRVTFLLDYWSVMPKLYADSKRSRVTLRGMVRVAGKRTPTKSSRRRAWRIQRDSWTAIKGEDSVDPYTVMWRELFRLYGNAQSSDDEGGGPSVSSLEGILFSLYGRFQETPSEDELIAVLAEEWEHCEGQQYGSLQLAYAISSALEVNSQHLGPWRGKRSAAAGANLLDPAPRSGMA